MTLSARVVRGLEVGMRRVMTSRLNEFRERAAELEHLPDDAIAAACREMIATPKLQIPDEGPSVLPMMDVEEGDAQALALAAEAFTRFPPRGVERGARLFHAQILTAIHLLRGTLVQMDTGEGKTYALAAAALAMLRLHARVYVITANPYLAIRDAADTAPFWQGCGASVGLALPSEFRGTTAAIWDADVIYTTLKALVHHSLEEELNGEDGMVWGAVLIDEADEVLLEQAALRYILPRHTAANTKNWKAALALARTLGESDVEVDVKLLPSTVLTPSGEAKVLAAAGQRTLSNPERLQLLHEVELAYTATRVAAEGHHYDIRDGAVVTINPATGWHTPTLSYEWVAPLAQHLGLAQEPNWRTLQLSDGITTLQRFAHRAGTSGTVIDEALEYAMLLNFLPAIVPPRTPRQDGLLEDLMFRTEEAAHHWVAGQIAEQGPRRPILIATDTTPEAFTLAARIEDSAPEGVTVRAVSGETIAEERVFETAGEPGVTIVSTRVAGRGVDIVLSLRAKENGGAMLISIGHSMEPRLDRQLLGRVGRRGDPYTAQFVFHPDTTLVGAVTSEDLIKKIAQTFMNDDEAISAKILTTQLRRGQRRLRLGRLASFVGGVNQGVADGQAYEMLTAWRAALLGRDGEGVPETFGEFAAERLISTRFPGLEDGRAASLQSRALADKVAEVVGKPEDAAHLALDTVGQSPGHVRAAVVAYLREALATAVSSSEQERDRMRQQRNEAEHAILTERLLNTITRLAHDRTESALEFDSSLGALLDRARIAQSRVRTGALDEHLARLDASLAGDAELWDDVEDGRPRVVGRSRNLSLLVRDAVTAIAGPGSDCASVEARAAAMLEVTRPEVEALDRPWHHLLARTPFAIAQETINAAAERLATGLDELRFRISHTTSGARFYATYAREVERLRGDIEAGLATSMCVNMIAGADPASLDGLFGEREHQISVRVPYFDVVLPDLPAQKPRVVAGDAERPALAGAATAMEYFTGLQARLGRRSPDEQDVLPALNWITIHCREGTLANSDLVAAAYHEWRRSQTREESAPPWRRRKLDWYVRGYLAFLNERGLAARLPRGPAEVSRGMLRRARAGFRTTGPVLGLLLLVGALVALAGMAFIPTGNGVSLSPAAAYVERLFALGTFSSGRVIAIALIGVIAAVAFRVALGVPTSQPLGLVAGEHLMSTLAMIAGALALVPVWGSGLGAATVGAVAGCLAAIMASLVVRNAIWQAENLTQCQITAGIAAAFAVCGALPSLAGEADARSIAVIGAFTALATLASGPMRHVSIPATAIRTDASTEAPDTLRVFLPVRAPLSSTPHLHALVVSWFTANVLVGGDAVARCVAGGAAYWAVLFWWARALSKRATDPARWQAKMRLRDEAYDAQGPNATLSAALARARTRVIAAEMLLAAAILALAGAFAADTPAGVLRDIPVGPAAVFATVLALDLGTAFSRSARLALGGFNTQPLADEPEQGSLAEMLRDAVRHINKKFGFALLLAVAIIKLANAVGIVETLDHVVSWIGRIL
jgi:hypothetical protein